MIRPTDPGGASDGVVEGQRAPEHDYEPHHEHAMAGAFCEVCGGDSGDVSIEKPCAGPMREDGLEPVLLEWDGDARMGGER